MSELNTLLLIILASSFSGLLILAFIYLKLRDKVAQLSKKTRK